MYVHNRCITICNTNMAVLIDREMCLFYQEILPSIIVRQDSFYIKVKSYCAPWISVCKLRSVGECYQLRYPQDNAQPLTYPFKLSSFLKDSPTVVCDTEEMYYISNKASTCKAYTTGWDQEGTFYTKAWDETKLKTFLN